MDQKTTGYSYSNQDPTTSKHYADEIGHWIIDASKPGSDVPEIGRSLFDMIVMMNSTDESINKIPFPFSRLIEKIRSQMKDTDNTIQRVRIPIGRSLRRNIAAPDYFHSPRIIIATDSEPSSGQGYAGVNLRGRLFLGYQEKSNILEIISYNPWAGRFEFQEVLNYGANLTPTVKYANRTLCLSCHQNAGPIFSTEPWLETDSNQQIRMQLPKQVSASKVKAEYLPRFDNVWALDYATDRANYFASSQFIWQHACGNDESSIRLDAIQCRAAMFKAILQYHLLDFVDQNSISFRDWFLPVILRNWQQKWPSGLLIATADIEDKNPFSVSAIAAQDPLNPRQPRAKWLKPSSHLLTGIIYQTADFITESDIFEIDQFLKDQAQLNNAPEKRYQSTCSLKRTADIGLQQHLEFSCQDTNSLYESAFNVTGAFIVEGDHIVDGNINTLTLPSIAANLRFLDLANTTIKKQGELLRASIPVNKYQSQIGARLFDGTLIKQLEFVWPASLEEFNNTRNQPASLFTVDDIEPLYLAIDKMIENNLNGNSDTFSSKPFRRHSLVKSLHQELGMPALKWQHEIITTTNIIENKPASSKHSEINYAEEFSPFYRHCSSCHLTKGHFPPGFLAGTKAEVKQQLTACAKKILVRLSLWKNKPQDRLISPMPPSSWLSIVGASEYDWLNSNDFKLMQQISSQLLTEQTPLPAQLSKTNSVCL